MPIIRQTTNIKVIPAGVTPTYNETIVVLESANIISDNFKWIVKIYKGESTDPDYELLSTINILPNPEGYGVIDFHRHIENHISTSFYPADIDKVSGKVVDEGLKWSFELIEQFENPRWRYYDYYTPPLSGNRLGFTTDTGIYSTATDIPHPFIITDRVQIVQDPGFTYPQYNFTDVAIYDIPSAYSILLDETYVGSGPQDPGLITLIGGGSREIEQIFNAGETTIYSFNGALSFQGFRLWNSDDYSMSSTSPSTTKFLLNGPREFDITLNDRVWVNSLLGNTPFDSLRVRTDNGSYTVNQTYTPSGQHFINQNKIGAKDILETTDTFTKIPGPYVPPVDVNTTFIEVYPLSSLGSKVGETIRMNIVDDCSKYESIRFFYLDKFGSYLPLTFNKVSKQTNSNKRENYRQNYGRYDSVADAWGYTTYDRGTTTYDLNTTEKVTCTSDWMNEDMRDMVIDMLNSPSVYIQDDNGEYIAITITTNSYEIKKKVNVKLINYTLTFEYAQMNTNQRG